MIEWTVIISFILFIIFMRILINIIDKKKKQVEKDAVEKDAIVYQTITQAMIFTASRGYDVHVSDDVFNNYNELKKLPNMILILQNENDVLKAENNKYKEYCKMFESERKKV